MKVVRTGAIETYSVSQNPYCREGVAIAVSGLPGSGKSTLARLLAEKLGLRYVSSGMLFRKLAKERGMNLLEFSKLAERDYSIDRMIDDLALAEGKKGCVVVDGHIAGWVLKDVALTKIYLYAPQDVRASRIANRDGKGFDEALAEVRAREESEARRFKAIYGIDVRNIEVFDIAINTSSYGIEETLELALEAVRKSLEKLKDQVNKQG